MKDKLQANQNKNKFLEETAELIRKLFFKFYSIEVDGEAYTNADYDNAYEVGNDEAISIKNGIFQGIISSQSKKIEELSTENKNLRQENKRLNSLVNKLSAECENKGKAIVQYQEKLKQKGDKL